MTERSTVGAPSPDSAMLVKPTAPGVPRSGGAGLRTVASAWPARGTGAARLPGDRSDVPRLARPSIGRADYGAVSTDHRKTPGQPVEALAAVEAAEDSGSTPT